MKFRLARIVIGVSVIAICAPVLALSPEEHQTIGSREGRALNGYAPLSSSLNLSEAKRFLGKNAVDMPCRLGREMARCLTYLQVGEGMQFAATHYFVDGENKIAVVYGSPIDSDGLWIPIQYCHAVPELVLWALIALNGRPDRTEWPKHYSFDPRFTPEWPGDWRGGRYRVQVARFVFPLGGEIRFEYVELPERSCMTRALYYWAP
jgi:hypothetical protein